MISWQWQAVDLDDGTKAEDNVEDGNVEGGFVEDSNVAELEVTVADVFREAKLEETRPGTDAAELEVTVADY